MRAHRRRPWTPAIGVALPLWAAIGRSLGGGETAELSDELAGQLRALGDLN